VLHRAPHQRARVQNSPSARLRSSTHHHAHTDT
jgi:hypothetical protein